MHVINTIGTKDYNYMLVKHGRKTRNQKEGNEIPGQRRRLWHWWSPLASKLWTTSSPSSPVTKPTFLVFSWWLGRLAAARRILFLLPSVSLNPLSHCLTNLWVDAGRCRCFLPKASRLTRLRRFLYVAALLAHPRLRSRYSEMKIHGPD